MNPNVLFTDQVSTITSLILRLIHQAGFILGLRGLHKQAAGQKIHQPIDILEITLQKSPESRWPVVTQDRRMAVGLFVGADFILGVRRWQ